MPGVAIKKELAVLGNGIEHTVAAGKNGLVAGPVRSDFLCAGPFPSRAGVEAVMPIPIVLPLAGDGVDNIRPAGQHLLEVSPAFAHGGPADQVRRSLLRPVVPVP